MLRALKAQGLELKEITSAAPRYLQRFPSVLWRLMRDRCYGPDIYFVGFLGHPIVPLLRSLGKKPIVFDPFISLFDTLCNDRQRFSPHSLAGRMMFNLDKWACESADLILLDTNSHIDYFSGFFSQPREKFQRVWVGADDRLYFPRPQENGGQGKPIQVFYYATFQPLHGVDVVLDAIELLRKDANVNFKIVGKGPELKRLQGRIDRAVRGGNCSWRPWVKEEELPAYIAGADICLGGHFSTMPKAKRVIPGKTYQFMAMRRPVIAGDNLANRELLNHGRDALFVKMGEPEELAGAISLLAGDGDMRESLAENGYKTYVKKCTPEALAGELGDALDRMIDHKTV
jgi:glycosyltransferase involved in cell wall biosynthesis